MVLEGPCTRDTHCGGRERGATGAFGEGCSCDTPATHSELRKEPRQGCSYTVERDKGGCSVCPTKVGLPEWVQELLKLLGLTPPPANFLFPGNLCCSQRTPWGGGKKRGVENLTNDTPPKKGVWTPLVRYVFHPPKVSVLCFSCTKIHDGAYQKLFWEGSKNFSGERVLWYVFYGPMQECCWSRNNLPELATGLLQVVSGLPEGSGQIISTCPT